MPSTSTSLLRIWVIAARLSLVEPGPLTTATSLSPVDLTKAAALSALCASAEGGSRLDNAAVHTGTSVRKCRRLIIKCPSSGNGIAYCADALAGWLNQAGTVARLSFRRSSILEGRG